jgi:hypothetical protein
LTIDQLKALAEELSYASDELGVIVDAPIPPSPEEAQRAGEAIAELTRRTTALADHLETLLWRPRYDMPGKKKPPGRGHHRPIFQVRRDEGIFE